MVVTKHDGTIRKKLVDVNHFLMEDVKGMQISLKHVAIVKELAYSNQLTNELVLCPKKLEVVKIIIIDLKSAGIMILLKRVVVGSIFQDATATIIILEHLKNAMSVVEG